MTDHRLTVFCKRALLASAIGLALTAPVAAQQQEQPNPAVQQFGPRKLPTAQQGQQGQQQRPQQKPPEVMGTYGDWVLQCENEAAAEASAQKTAQNNQGAVKSDPETKTKKANADEAEDHRACGMVQTARNEERKNVALTLVLMKGEQQGKPVTMMRVMAPIGVYLPTGVALEIDGAAVGRVPFTRCLPQVCVAFAEASPPTLEKLRKGGKANFIIYEAPGLGISLALSLKGFTAGLDALGKL
ncbi:MAG: invasion associated locus B family protein [Parvibaculaceae bacterium]